MAGVRKTPSKRGLYEGWYRDAEGQRRFFTGTASKRETLLLAQKKEDLEREVKVGLRPAPSKADQQRRTAFDVVKDEYLAWGASQGGRRGMPWGATHLRNRRAHLAKWQEWLDLRTLQDLEGCLAPVEKRIRLLQEEGKSGKGIQNVVEALAAFCDWAVRRDYLAADPLRHLSRIDTTPATTRRCLSAEELGRLFKAAEPHRRLLYEVATVSGLRAGELRNLAVHHLDLVKGGLHLDASWTKSRKAGFQPLPSGLVKRLHEAAGHAKSLYSKRYARRDATLTVPADPLLHVPSHTARELDIDLARAEIPKVTAEGKVDFHALRVAYVNLLINAGTSVKDTQALARHASVDLTWNIYGRTTPHQLAAAVEKLGALFEDE